MARLPRRIKRGDRQPGAAWYGDLDDYLGSLYIEVGDGGELEIDRTDGGSTLHFARYNCHKVARAGSGGIPARSGFTPGWAICALYPFDGATLVESVQMPVYNWAGSAVAANAWLIVGLIDGKWFVFSEDCAAASVDPTSFDFNADFGADFSVDPNAAAVTTEFNHDFNADFDSPFATGGTNELQRITPTGGPLTSGSWRLTFGGDTTAPIAWNATAADVQSALEALASIGSGNVSCSGGPINTTAVDVAFIGGLGGTNVAQLVRTVDFFPVGQDVAVSTITEGSP